MFKKIIITVAAVLVLLAVLLLWPFSSYDLSRGHSSIHSLEKPYRSVTAEYYLDGGSVGIDITDRNGQRLQLAIPVYADDHTRRRLFMGATHISETNVVEISFTRDTKRCLADIVDRYAAPGTDRNCAVIALRGNPRDYARICTQILLSRVTDR